MTRQGNPIGRRSVLAGAAAVAATAATPAAASAAASAVNGSGSPASAQSESARLSALYQAAKAEGGRLTIYAGGDTLTQQDPLKQGFMAQFPGLDVNMVVDLSKVHAARYDAQVSARNIVADVLELQTLDVFPRWKNQHSLLHYKPVGFDRVHPAFKDHDGYFTGVVVLAFANVTSTSLGSAAPIEAADFLKSAFTKKLVITFPNDDDAVLFFFHQLVEAYGWDYMAKLMAQKPIFVRGTAASAGAVYGGQAAATYGTFSGLQSAPGDAAKFTLPKRSPFVSWAQTAAIPAKAPHPAAAKLYLSWLLSKPVQGAGSTFPSRIDVPNPPGYHSIFSYRNTDPTAFGRFLADRNKVERFKARIQLYVGDVMGDSPTGVLGFTPGEF